MKSKFFKYFVPIFGLFIIGFLPLLISGYENSEFVESIIAILIVSIVFSSIFAAVLALFGDKLYNRKINKAIYKLYNSTYKHRGFLMRDNIIYGKINTIEFEIIYEYDLISGSNKYTCVFNKPSFKTWECIQILKKENIKVVMVDGLMLYQYSLALFIKHEKHFEKIRRITEVLNQYN